MRISGLRSRRRFRNTVRANVTVGEGFTFGNGTAVWAPTRLQIGNDVKLGSNVRIEVDGHIGDSCLIANSVGIVGKSDHDIGQVGTPIAASNWVGKFSREMSQEVVIGSDVWVGFGAIILSGVIIGDSAVIGAGSVVTRNIPANAIAVGNPARVIGQRFSDDDFTAHWVSLESLGLLRLPDESRP